MRHHPSPTAARALAPALLLVAILAAGCGNERMASVTAPDASAGVPLGTDAGGPAGIELRTQGLLHTPLAVGNRWDYRMRLRTRTVAQGADEVITVSEAPWSSEIVGEQEIGQRRYFLQSEYDPRVAAPPPLPQFALRQNRSGLYNLDLYYALGTEPDGAPTGDGEALAAQLESAVRSASANSPHRAAFAAAAARLGARLAGEELPSRIGGLALPFRPGDFERPGPLPGEISLLRYPLYTGARWVVRDSPRFARVVVGREPTTVPAGTFTAWVLRGRSELYGPNDRVRFWYAREGLIKAAFHGEMDVTDELGNVIGHLTADMDQSLTGLTLASLLALD